MLAVCEQLATENASIAVKANSQLDPLSYELVEETHADSCPQRKGDERPHSRHAERDPHVLAKKRKVDPAWLRISSTLRAFREWRMTYSRPTKKRKSTRPSSETRLRNGKLGSGKMCSVKPGILPNAVGPTATESSACCVALAYQDGRMIPPRTSLITRGWQIGRASCRERVS